MEPEKVIIRQATVKDVEVIAGFNRAMALETENKRLEPAVSRAGVIDLIKHPEAGFYLVAEISAGTTLEIAGALMVTPEWSDWRDGYFWWIQSVYIVPAHRRAGLYRRMYQKVKELAGERPDIRGFRLYVERGNHAARKVYERLGMTVTSYRIYEEAR